ncbi:hypothetical protein MOVI109754_20095 [Moritella viscosa]
MNLICSSTSRSCLVFNMYLIYHKVYDMHLNDYIIFYPKYDVIKYLQTYKNQDYSISIELKCALGELY